MALAWLTLIKVSEETTISIFGTSLTLMMNALGCSELLVNFYATVMSYPRRQLLMDTIMRIPNLIKCSKTYGSWGL